MARTPPLDPGAALRELRAVQDDVATRAQLLAAGLSPAALRAQLSARRWQVRGPGVVVLHNGPLTGRQRLWCAVLAGGGQLCALAGPTAAAAQGLSGFEDERVHLVVPRGARLAPQPWVRLHESRRFGPEDLHPSRRPATVRLERAVVDTACWSGSPRRACGVLAAAVQQRLSTAARLRRELLDAGRVRHRALLLAVLGDIEGGSQSMAEVDFVRLCRRHGLPAPVRQEPRLDRSGRRRYLDVAWERPGGRAVVAEVDGALHLLARTYWDDMDRANELVIAGSSVLRFSSATVRLDPGRVADQLARLLLAPRHRLLPRAG